MWSRNLLTTADGYVTHSPLRHVHMMGSIPVFHMPLLAFYVSCVPEGAHRWGTPSPLARALHATHCVDLLCPITGTPYTNIVAFTFILDDNINFKNRNHNDS
eukprot:2005765-Amphidinium_carterae.1